MVGKYGLCKSVSKYLNFGILLKIKLNTLEMWPPSGMSLQIILFGKIIHRTVELDMSSSVKVPVLTYQERGVMPKFTKSVDEPSKNQVF